MIQGRWYPQGSDLTVPLRLRRAVFGLDRDPLDDLAQQVVVFDGETPVGAARLWWAEGAFRLGEVGVVAGHRGQGFGDLLTRLLMAKALTHQATRLTLASPAETVPFFARYGFAPVHPGAEETMVEMFLLPENIRLSHCQAECGGNCSSCPKGQ